MGVGMKIDVNAQDFVMLCRMAERGWADGDFAEYLNADQIAACLRVLETLNQAQKTGLPKGPARVRRQASPAA